MDLLEKNQNSEPEIKELTPDTLRLYKGYEDVSDEEAIQVIESIKCFSKLLLEALKFN